MLIGVNPHEKSQLKPTTWVGWKKSDVRERCTVEAESWWRARELVRAMLRTDDVEVVQEVEVEP